MNATRLWSMLIGAALVIAVAVPAAQTLGEKERFNAIAMVNNTRAAGAGTSIARAPIRSAKPETAASRMSRGRMPLSRSRSASMKSP